MGSDCTIRSLGGVLERTEIDPSDNILTNVYWIDVNKSLQDYSKFVQKNALTKPPGGANSVEKVNRWKSANEQNKHHKGYVWWINTITFIHINC